MRSTVYGQRDVWSREKERKKERLVAEQLLGD